MQPQMNQPPMEPMDEDERLLPTVLTDWENEPTVSQLKEDLQAAKPSHDSLIAKVRRWNNLLKVEGEAKPKKVKGRSSVQPKVIRRQAEWRYSALSEPLLSSEDLFEVKPRTAEDLEGAWQNQLVINWQFRTKLNRVKFIDDFIRAAVDEGTCVVRVGWRRVTEMVPEEVPVWTYLSPQSQEELEQLEMALQYKAENPRGFLETVPEEIRAAVEYFEETGQPNVAILSGSEVIQVEKVIENRPTLDIMNLANISFDPSCGPDLDRANFAIVSFETSKAELLKQPNIYKNLDKVSWDSSSLIMNTNHESTTPQDFNFRDAVRKRVIAYEYWGFYDIHGTGELVPIVATWIGDTMIRLERNPYPDQKLPFVVVTYNPLKRELNGEPDAELLEDNQKIIGATMRGIVDQMARSANGQQGIPKGMLDALNYRRMQEGQDFEYNPGNSPEIGIYHGKFQEIPQAAIIMMNVQNQEAEALTGVKSFSGGISGEAYGEVAAGIRGALDAASKREMAILRRMAQGIQEIGAKIISMNQAFLSEEEVVRVTNETFVTIQREDLAGQYDMIVDISTPEVDNSKAQDLGFMLQTIGPNMDFAMTQLILTEIARLKRMPTLAKMIQNFKPEPDPLDQKVKELEIRKLEAEVRELETVAMLNEAKARREIATAEATDVNTIAEATGTKHARDMEKQAGQARGNQDLQITKALTDKKKEGEQTGDIEAAVGWNEFSKARATAPDNIDALSRNALAENDPRLSIGSKYYDPRLDPVNPVNQL